MRKWSIVLLLLLIASSSGLGAYVWYGAAHPTKHSAAQALSANQHIHLPDFVQEAGTEAAVAYQYATDQPDILAQIPCHCGCEKALVHKNNLDCYITGFTAEGDVVQYDNHAAYCAVCLEITAQVIKRVSEGQAPPAIHVAIDTQYGYSGPHPHVIGPHVIGPHVTGTVQ